jgi:hypothetical protein
VRLSYATGSRTAPPSLVVKLPLDDTVLGELVEIGFYRHLAAESPLASPHCYHAGADETGRWVLVLDDLAALESPGDIEGLSPEQAGPVVERLAAFHGRFWGRSHPWADDFHPWTVIVARRLERNLGATLERACRVLDQERLELCRRLPEKIEWIVAAVEEQPHTIIHTDFRADNIFLGPDGTPVGIDWENVSHQAGATDLARLLGTSLQPEHLRAHTPTLIDRYLRSLRAAGVRDCGRRELERDIRVSLVFWLAHAIGLLPDPRLGTGRPLRVVETGLDRYTSAVPHLDALAALSQPRSARLLVRSSPGGRG